MEVSLSIGAMACCFTSRNRPFYSQAIILNIPICTLYRVGVLTGLDSLVPQKALWVRLLTCERNYLQPGCLWKLHHVCVCIQVHVYLRWMQLKSPFHKDHKVCRLFPHRAVSHRHRFYKSQVFSYTGSIFLEAQNCEQAAPCHTSVSFAQR